MKRKFKYLLIACLAIVLVDVIGSITSRQFNYNYAKIWPASLAVYVTLSIVLSKREPLLTTVWITALLGTVDATIGWKVSMLLNANTGAHNNHPSVIVWAITVVFVTIYAAVVGLIVGSCTNFLAKQFIQSKK